MRRSNQKIRLPLNEPFHNHILGVVGFVQAYCFCIESDFTTWKDVDMPPPDALAAITTNAEIKALHALFVAAKPDGVMRLSQRNALLLYACYVLMSQALVAPIGEMMAEEILKGLADDHDLKQFKAYRDIQLLYNTSLINNSEQALVDIKGFAAMKEALNNLSFLN